MIAEFDSSSSTAPQEPGSIPALEVPSSTTDSSSSSGAPTNNGNENGTVNVNGNGVGELEIIKRVGGIPLVADGVGAFENVIKSTQITTNLYNAAGGIAAKSLDIASPYLAKGQPYIAKADGFAVQTLDLVESKFPYPFKASTGEIVESTKAAYDQNIAVYLHTEIVQRALGSIYGLKEKITASGQYAASQVHAVAAGIVDQLYQIVGSKDLPAVAKENIGAVYEDLRKITGEGDKSTQQKAGEIVTYVQNKVQPELEKLSGLVFKQKEEVEKKAGELKANGEAKADEVTQQASEATS